MPGPKDAALGFGLRSLLNARLQGIGEVTDLSVDTGRRRVELRLALRGEGEPMHVEVRRFDLERVDGTDWVTVVEAVASREWVTAALQQYVVGRRFPIPSKAATVLRFLT